MQYETQSAIGDDVVIYEPMPNTRFRTYVIERPAYTAKQRAIEVVLEVSLSLSYSARELWPTISNSNLWMGRFGYAWDAIPAENEDKFVHLGNVGAANDLKYGRDGARTRYVIRKVIPERLIYQDSLPMKLADKDAFWSGRNLLMLTEDRAETTVQWFMEHTWYSETLSIEDLRAEAKGAMVDAAVAFWRDYFLPDLIDAVRRAQSAGETA